MHRLLICLAAFGLSQSLCAQKEASRSSTNWTIAWDQPTLKAVSPITGNYSANYARMIQLDNGNLLCVYEAGGSIACTSSMDSGRTWQLPVLIAAGRDGVNYCVPEILQLSDRSLLVSFNPRPRKTSAGWDTTKHFAIRTIKSYDNGINWRDERLAYEAGYRFEDGCWEPAQVQLPSGEIRLFFSNEAIYTKTNEQNISMLRSFDGGLTWTSKAEIVSFTPGHRDGMPVPVLLDQKAQIAFCIEDNLSGQFRPSIIKIAAAENLHQPVGPHDTRRINALAPAPTDTIYAGAPYLRQLKSGPTILSWQSTENRRRQWELSSMQVAVGDAGAENFHPALAPFNIPPDKHGLWNSLCILKDDTIIALTSTNAFSPATAIWMIKGKLVRIK
jgi:hypothetical protein